MTTTRHQSVGTSPRASRMTYLRRWQAARPIADGLALVALGTSSVLGLSGCQAVEAIFKVGVWFGVLIVVAIVAVAGAIAAMVLRKKK